MAESSIGATPNTVRTSAGRAARRKSSILTFVRRMPGTVPLHLLAGDNENVNHESSLWLPWWFLWVAAIASGYVSELHRQKRFTAKPILYHQQDGSELVKRMPSLHREVRPTFLFGTWSVLNSLTAYFKIGPRRKNSYSSTSVDSFREIMIMPQDGERIAIDWELPQNSSLLTRDHILSGPIRTTVVIILHGINNDASFGYIRSAMRSCTDRGWAAAGVNMRGCGGLDMATPRGYNGAYTGDIRCVVNKIAARIAPNKHIFLVGNSLGANLVVKYLGEEGLSRTLPKCVAGGISLGNPLSINSSNLKFPWNIILALGVKKTLLFHRKSILNSKGLARDSFYRALRASTIGETDHILAPTFLRNESMYPFETSIGYSSGEEYWKDASSYLYVKHVSVPLLKITALDDFLTSHNVLSKMAECLINPKVIIVKTKSGGHLGWNDGSGLMSVLFDKCWADKVMVEFIDAVLQLKNAEVDDVTLKSDRGEPNQGEPQGGSTQILQSKL